MSLDPGDGADLASELAQIETLLRQRDVAGATATIERIAAGKWSERQLEQIARHSALISAAGNFWHSFERALEGVAAGRTVQWSGHPAALVEVGRTHLVVRRAGQNIRVPRDKLSVDRVLDLAEGLLDLDDPRNQVSLGAIHFIKRGADSSEARRLWESAARAGEDVSLLLPLLGAP
jgi:hypothetical protein